MKSDWIMVANATQARLLGRERGGPMVVLQNFAHPQGRAKVSDLADGRAGQEKTDHDFSSAAFQPHVNAKQKEHTRFARELADYLEQQAQPGSFRSLAIFASSPFLGELKAQLGAATSRLLSGAHDLDLTSFDLGEMEQRIKRALAR